MTKCRGLDNKKRCHSYAINPHLHGREKGVDLDLCDVCYWRKRAEAKKSKGSERHRISALVTDHECKSGGDSEHPYCVFCGEKVS